MSPAPAHPKIYHITHLRNLPQIIADGGLWSDAERVRRSLDCQIVGMSEIKRRRLEELEVACYPGTKVGQYVPFYFCPRSIMLYILYQRNHPDISYHEGQDPIVHLQADLHAVVQWAQENQIDWAFSTSNAGARYSSFHATLDSLHEINWAAVAATDFRNSAVQDGKQAEFLLYNWFPWKLIEKVGVHNQTVKDEVADMIASADFVPPISRESSWYF
jgi:hypothetical protein